ncbi:TlpA family protein disulfide reductase [Granulicoccus sp. GXG6511]|uniref:TlpA family protein disulfide reductase n=1 Tax=Granulicoccus sp. GXG6511 TaxID=3381351 RepID=UPI003D7D9F82
MQRSIPHRLAIALVGIFLVVTLAACSAGSGGAEGFVAGKTGLTRVAVTDRVEAPITTGPGLGGGEVTTHHPGKVVVINVWGSWCEPCRAEAADLEAAWQDTKDVAQFVGIDTRDPDPAPAIAFVRAFGITYPSIFDPQGRSLLEFSGTLPPSGIPSTLIVDADGRIAARIIGEVDRTTLTGLVRDTAEGR